MKKVADALTVSIDYLLGRVEEPKSSGPVAEELFRDFEQMSADGQETLKHMASILAQKNKK